MNRSVRSSVAGELGRLQVAAVAGDELAGPVVRVGQVEPQLAGQLPGSGPSPVTPCARSGRARRRPGSGTTPRPRTRSRWRAWSAAARPQRTASGAVDRRRPPAGSGGRSRARAPSAARAGQRARRCAGAGRRPGSGATSSWRARRTTAWAKAARWPSPTSRTTPARTASSSRWRRSITRPPTRGRQHVERELLADERRRGQRVVDLGRQAGQPPPHDVVDPLGQAVAGPACSAPRPGRRGRGRAGSRARTAGCRRSRRPASGPLRPRPRRPPGGRAPGHQLGRRRRGPGPAPRCGRPTPALERCRARAGGPSPRPRRRAGSPPRARGPPGGESSTWRSSSSDERSAHCRSSSTSSTGRRAAMAPEPVAHGVEQAQALGVGVVGQRRGARRRCGRRCRAGAGPARRRGRPRPAAARGRGQAAA